MLKKQNKTKRQYLIILPLGLFLVLSGCFTKVEKPVVYNIHSSPLSENTQNNKVDNNIPTSVKDVVDDSDIQNKAEGATDEDVESEIMLDENNGEIDTIEWNIYKEKEYQFSLSKDWYEKDHDSNLYIRFAKHGKQQKKSVEKGFFGAFWDGAFFSVERIQKLVSFKDFIIEKKDRLRKVYDEDIFFTLEELGFAEKKQLFLDREAIKFEHKDVAYGSIQSDVWVNQILINDNDQFFIIKTKSFGPDRNIYQKELDYIIETFKFLD